MEDKEVKYSLDKIEDSLENLLGLYIDQTVQLSDLIRCNKELQERMERIEKKIDQIIDDTNDTNKT